jgi:hypothetical protein
MLAVTQQLCSSTVSVCPLFHRTKFSPLTQATKGALSACWNVSGIMLP